MAAVFPAVSDPAALDHISVDHINVPNGNQVLHHPFIIFVLTRHKLEYLGYPLLAGALYSLVEKTGSSKAAILKCS